MQLLKDSAAQCYVPALNAMGHHYFESGKTEENKRKAAGMFEQAAKLGSHVAPLLAFVCLEKSDPTKALWYLALACKYNSERAKNYMIQMIPKVISGKRRDLLVEEQVIRNAIDGLIEYRDRAIDILIKRIHAYEKHDDFDEAFNTLDKLEQIEPNIAKHERDELENNLPDWYVEEMYSRDNYEIEYYSREDSLSDALDDDPGSYWNID